MIANRLIKKGKFTHTKNWREIQTEWNANADPLDDFATRWVKDSSHHRSKRDVYLHYKEYCFEKGEVPLGMGQFGKLFAEYFEESKNDNTRIWCNIELIEPPKNTKLEKYALT